VQGRRVPPVPPALRGQNAVVVETAGTVAGSRNGSVAIHVTNVPSSTTVFEAVHLLSGTISVHLCTWPKGNANIVEIADPTCALPIYQHACKGGATPMHNVGAWGTYFEVRNGSTPHSSPPPMAHVRVSRRIHTLILSNSSP
jgi:hypothetical protein